MTTNEDLENIYSERSSYLLNIDDLLEQILEDQYNFIPEKTHLINLEISQENNIRIDTGAELAFASNF